MARAGADAGLAGGPDRSPAEAETDADIDADPGLRDSTFSADAVTFVRQAQRQAWWRRRWVRASLSFACLLLATGLAAQAALQERDWIAASWPQARPVLEALCRPLACSIAPRRQIDAVAIDSSSFNKGRGDNYQLRLVLKNTAAIPLAMPAVELTLTDTADQAVVRRVLTPAELGAANALPARGEWSGSWAVGLGAVPGTAGPAPRVAGYRVLVFYP